MTLITFDTNRSLQELEGVDWGEPTYHTSLVIDCHRLRRVALKDFTDDDLARMLGQQISLPFLVPLAIEAVRKRPCQSGELYYGGTLLSALLGVEAEFWKSRQELALEALHVVKGLPARIAKLEDYECVGVQSALSEMLPVFLKRTGLHNP